MKHFKFFIWCCIIAVCLCACRPDAAPESSFPTISDVPVTQVPASDDTGLPIQPVGTLESLNDATTREFIFAQNVIPSVEGLDVVLPIASVPVGKSISAIVQVDDSYVSIEAVATKSGKYIVWYGDCRGCVEAETTVHPLINYNDELVVRCSVCGKIFNLSDLSKGNSTRSDLCAPYVLSEDRYQVRPTGECDVLLTVFPWLNSSLEWDPSWGVAQTSLASLRDKDCIVIPYETLKADSELIQQWYAASVGDESAVKDYTLS